MNKRHPLVAVGVVAVLLSLAGCIGEPDPKEAAKDVDQSRADVTRHVKEAAELLTKGGMNVPKAGVSVEVCGAAGISAPTIAFTGGATVKEGDGSVNERVVAATETFKSAGWKVRLAEIAKAGDAYARLTKDGLDLSIDRASLRGSDDIVFGIRGSCIEVTTEQSNELIGTKEQIVP